MCGRYYINDETAKEIERLIRQINDSLLTACRERDVYPSGKAPVITGRNDRLYAEEFRALTKSALSLTPAVKPHWKREPFGTV